MIGPNHALKGAPMEYAMPATRPTLEQSQLWCRQLVSSHYENFHVATFFLPRRIRPYFESIYAFSRVADDLGDEVADHATAVRLLHEWDELLRECYVDPGASRHPVFVALHQTIEQTGAPRQLFADLIQAFIQDQTKTYFDSLAELEDYSRLSANPVGRLVLWVSGYGEEQPARASDNVCTALQLANFWQDVVEDLERGRRYLPKDAMERFGVSEAMLRERPASPEFRAMMAFLCGYTETMLRDGARVAAMVDPELAVTLRLFVRGGEAALAGIRAQGYDVLSSRPSVSKLTKLKLLGGALAGKALGNLRPEGAGR